MKKAVHNFSKLLAWAFFGVALFSCSNASGGYDSSSSNRKSYPVVRFVANMQSDFAAAPQEISGLVSRSAGTTSFYNDGASRSAMPEIAPTTDEDGIKYYVEAVTGTPGMDSYIRHFVYGTTSTLELGLESGNTWNVTCGIGEIGPEDSEDPNSKKIVLTNYMFDNDPSVTITPDEPVYVKTFGLKPSITTDGTGTINLKLKIMAETWYVKVSCSAQGWKDANEGAETIVLNEHQDNDSPILHIGSIKSGMYDVVFKFYDDKDALNYCTVQTINVFDDMTTSVWRDDGSGAVVVTEGGLTVFNVTDAVINLFTQTTMYVGDTGLGGLAPNDQNSGTAFEPLATLQEAAFRIYKYGKSVDYTIFVSGTVQGCTTFDTELTSTKPKTITIMGYNDSGDKLKGYASKLGNIVDFNGVPIGTYFPESKEFNPVITVKTAVPITIQNVDICEGASNGGSGLCIDGAGCSVTIKDGVTISGNKTGRNGGGVQVRQGKFYMKGGVIEKNVAFNSLAGNCNGGGVCLRAGAYFEMTGGEIRENRACMGGGVGLVNLDGDSGSNKFSLKRGKISQNTADGFTSSNKCGFGGGIIITSGSETVHHQVTMTGGEISGNKVNVDSSAVEVSSSAIFEMTGGVIKDNGLVEGEEGSSNYSDISVGYAANYFCLGGSAYIPAGSDKKHCVYLNGYKKDADTPLQMAKINVDSNLSRHSQSDPLVIQFNTSGEHAAKRGATVASASFDLTDAKEYIVPASGDWNLKLSSDKKSLVLDAPIWVAGEDARQCTGTPTSAGTGTKADPFNTIQNACSVMDDPTVDYTIYVDGTVTGAQKISDTANAASITIQGANGNNSVDVLDGNGYDDHVLALCAQADTTIKDLKITGANITTENSGSSRARCGGGVYSATDKSVTLSSGTLIAGNQTVNGGGGVFKENGKLIIEDGAEISGSNMAANGGGVYLYGADLYMSGGKITGNSASGSEATGRGGGIYCGGGNSQPSNVYLWGKALVGRADISAPPTSSLSAHANDAMTGGGIYVYNGNLWLGYKDANKPQAFEKLSGDVVGGIIGNYGSQKGGGVYIDTSVFNNSLYMASGQIACNGTQTSNLLDIYHGGGIYILGGGSTKVDISGGSVKNNRSYKGGAIYNGGTGLGYLKIGGAADIPYGTNKKNDVYLNDKNSPITLASSLSPREAKNAIAITLNTSSFSNGDTVVKTDPERAVSSDELNCVKLSAEHVAAGLALALSFDGKSLKLDKPIYVKQGGSADADGTKTKPYASIEDACGAMTSTSLDYTILVDGIDPSTGDPMPLLDAQTIPEGTLAASITIRGANGLYPADHSSKPGEPKDALNGNNCNDPVLKAECSCPVILGNIKITGANNGANYGGVYRKNGDLYIQEGTLITRNTAGQGAGVFVSDCNLYMSGGQITSNESANSGGTWSGGICLVANTNPNCGAFIYGTAVIGGVNKEHPDCPTSTTTKDDVLNNGGNWCANQRGGGVGCFDANLYLGYKSANDDGSPKEEAPWTGGIYGNYVGGEGGGVYVRGKMYMNSGEIAYNYTNSNGGGVYNAGDFTMTGGEIYGNAVSASGAGGGVANGGFFGMKGGKIYANDGGLLGGGVYQSSGSSEIALSGDAVIGDSSKPNVAKQGGGIGCKDDVASITRIGWGWIPGSVSYTFTGGLIGNRATAGSGGAIYMNKSSKLYFFAGRISGNTASAGKGNGVYVHPEAGAMQMRGYVRFDASDDIWLAPPESGDPKTTITISKDGHVSGLAPTDTGAEGGTAADKTATITPGAYNPGDTILTGTGTLVSGNYGKFAVAPDPADPSQTWILDSDGCIYGSQPVLAIDRTNGMTSQDRNFITGAVVGSGTEDNPYVLELGGLDTLKFQIKGGSGTRVVHGGEGANNRINILASCTSLCPNYALLYNQDYLGDGIKIQMVLKSNYNPSDHTNEVHVPFWVLVKKPQYFMGTPYKDNNDGTVLFGDWPQTIKESSVNVSETIKVNQEVVSGEGGRFDYYLGSDGFWYVSQAENGYDPGGALSWSYNKNYSDGTQVGTGNSSSKWFKVEPIKWKVLATDAIQGGKKLLHAQSILEGRRFAEGTNNTYSGSEIQTYLQGLFYRSAFAPALRNKIQSTIISLGSGEDMVFLLSHDVTANSDYFSNADARIRAPTDFAKATGALHSYSTGGGIWWMRDSDEANTVYCVDSEGGANAGCSPSRSEIGLAPALWIMP